MRGKQKPIWYNVITKCAYEWLGGMMLRSNNQERAMELIRVYLNKAIKEAAHAAICEAEKVNEDFKWDDVSIKVEIKIGSANVPDSL